jgi:hypothetical protein
MVIAGKARSLAVVDRVEAETVLRMLPLKYPDAPPLPLKMPTPGEIRLFRVRERKRQHRRHHFRPVIPALIAIPSCLHARNRYAVSRRGPSARRKIGCATRLDFDSQEQPTGPMILVAGVAVEHSPQV